jgi:hypothetical protein
MVPTKGVEELIVVDVDPESFEHLGRIWYLFRNSQILIKLVI